MGLKNKCKSTVFLYGEDIISSEDMQTEKKFIQHGSTSVYEHSLNVAYLSIYIVKLLNLKVKQRDVVRGALLHDYFMYDWHVKDKSHSLHGFKHAKFALINAERDFKINPVEKDIIEKHMFPLNLRPPRYKESVVVCLADKISAIAEIFKR